MGLFFLLFLSLDVPFVQDELPPVPAEKAPDEVADTGLWLAVANRKVVAPWF